MDPTAFFQRLMATHPTLVSWLVVVLLARGLVLLTIGAIVNRLKAAGKPVPLWMDVVQDVLSFLPAPGKWGIFGPINMVGVPSFGGRSDDKPLS
jgi:hypothetical protein